VGTLAVLRHNEGVRLDPDRLVALYSDLGEKGAERVICRATEELAARLREVQRLVDEGNGAAMQRSARLLIRVAEQVGMLTFARVAGDVLRATDAGDASAQAATLARLVRIGDRSLNAFWDLRDQTL
jgi:hypothetical protein